MSEEEEEGEESAASVHTHGYHVWKGAGLAGHQRVLVEDVVAAAPWWHDHLGAEVIGNAGFLQEGTMRTETDFIPSSQKPHTVSFFFFPFSCTCQIFSADCV